VAGPTIYRWQYDKWEFQNKPLVQEDFNQAVEHRYSFPRAEDPDPPDPPGGEMLSNPSFEQPYNRDSQNSTVSVAHDWRYFASDGKPPERDGPCELPEYKALNRFEDERRVYEGLTAQCWFIRWKIMDAGVYQVVEVEPGASYTFDVMCQAWCSQSDDPTVSDGDMHVLLGIDPTGGTDPWSSFVEWSGWDRVGADYKRYVSPTVEAEEAQITVFIRAWNKWELSHNDVYVDDAHLVKQGGGEPPGGGDVDYARIRRIVREEIDKTVWASGAA
jgi:hypothetical protein